MGGQVLGRRPCRERGRNGSVWRCRGSRGRRRGRTVVEVDIELHVIWVRGERHMKFGTGGVTVDKDDVDGLKVLKKSV